MIKFINCQIDGCPNKADYGVLAKGDAYEWVYMCEGHKTHLEEDGDTVRNIEDTPPFCDEDTARIPHD